MKQTGWFSVRRSVQGNRERFEFAPGSSAPKTVSTSPKGFQIPAAEVDFAGAKSIETTQDGARVTYRVRLVRPTAQFALFQALYPQARIGDTHERHASYRKEGRRWVLMETDEAFRLKKR